MLHHGRRLFYCFLLCLSLLTALPACVTHWTVETLQAMAPGVEVADTCVRPPTVEGNSGAFAHRIVSRETVSDRDRDAFERFAVTADIIYRYDPNLPPKLSRTLPWPYHHLTCESRSSSGAPPLPKEMEEIPITQATRDALIATLIQPESASLTAELTNRPLEKRFVAMGPITTRGQQVAVTEKLQQIRPDVARCHSGQFAQAAA